MELNSGDVVRLAESLGLEFPEEDLEPLCEALGSHFATVAPLMDIQGDDFAEWEGFAPVTFDAEWQ